MINHQSLIWTALFVLISGAGSAWAAPPSTEEQLWLEMINRFRADPVAELDILANYTTPGGSTFASPESDNPRVASALRFFNVDAAVLRSQFNALSPAPPLAWSVDLNDVSEYYSGVMITENRQSHNLDGLGLFDRVTTHSDYDFTGGGTVGENIFAFTDSVFQGHAGFIIDWGNNPPTGIQNPPGHRDSLISATFREIGIAMVEEDNPATAVGPFVVTQHLAADFADGPFLTGVAFTDNVTADGFYTPGEGQGGLLVEVFTAGSDNLITNATTWASGGYSIEVSPGTYDVRISNQSFSQTLANVEVGSVNLKLDRVALTGLSVNVDSTPQDPVAVTGAVSMAGTLDLVLPDGFTPDFGDTFSAVTANTRDGLFDQTNGVLPEGQDFALAPIYDFQGNAGLTIVTALPGDADLNETVALGDLGVLLDNLGEAGTWSQADFNGDGVVALGDLGTILDNLGRSAAAASPAIAAVPEPSTLLLTLFSTMGLLRRRVVRCP